MNVGTKSLLFGVHQFLWHPWTVARAWRFLHGRWPRFPEWVCIFCHDLGYWGCPNMDGPEGQRHPEVGAKLASRIIYLYARFRGHEVDDAEFLGKLYYQFSLFHSRFYAKSHNKSVSELFLPDKVCVLFEPRWWYILRASLSGEIHEYMANAGDRVAQENFGVTTKWTWHAWYQKKILNMINKPI